MPITLTCPGCESRLNAPDSAAGKTLKCPKCKAAVAVPASGWDVGIEADPPRANRSASVPPSKAAAKTPPPAPELLDLDDGEPVAGSVVRGRRTPEQLREFKAAKLLVIAAGALAVVFVILMGVTEGRTQENIFLGTVLAFWCLLIGRS
jgi:hypothetical protein